MTEQELTAAEAYIRQWGDLDGGPAGDLIDEVRRLRVAVEAGYWLSIWAATIEWSEYGTNHRAWLDELEDRINKVQAYYKVVG